MLSNFTWFWLAVAAIVCHVVAGKQDFANKLLSCARRTNFDECLRLTLEDLRGRMRDGIPELGLGPSEPFKIHNIRFLSRPRIGGVQIDATFTNVIVERLSTFRTRNISANIARRELYMELSVPEVNIRGFYKVDGQVIVFPISGHGPFNTTLFNVVGKGYGRMVPVGPKGNQTFSIRETNIDFEIGGARVKLDNLFGGQLKTLADTVNEFINDNSHLIIDKVKPQIKEEVNTLLQSVMNDAFSKLPIEEFLDKFPPQQVPRSNRSLEPQHRRLAFRH